MKYKYRKHARFSGGITAVLETGSRRPDGRVNARVTVSKAGSSAAQKALDRQWTTLEIKEFESVSEAAQFLAIYRPPQA